MGSLSDHPGGWADGVMLADTYLLGRRISQGGMGEVFEATHARLPGRYAVKVLRAELMGNREAFARFCREAEVMSELRHPNVVQIYDFNTTPDGRPYFVMEHLEGRDLETRLTQAGPLPLPAAVRVVESVSSALSTAHAHGIVHRDLKPSNVFLVAIDGQVDEMVKVLDFGISKVRASGTLLSTPTDMIGSPAYMSPEQARGAAAEVDGRSDQFALGAITYRMLTGYEPFQGNDIASLLYQVVHEPAPTLGSYLPGWWDTRALQAVLDRALAKEPAQRWPSMMEFARAFEAASEQTLSHDLASPGALGATLRATPPQLAPYPAPGSVAPASRDFIDAPPPVRTPTPEPLRPLPKQARPERDFEAPAGPPPPTAGAAGAWEEPYDSDQLPVTHHRLALAGLGLLAVLGFLFATGLDRRIIAAARRGLGLSPRTPVAAPPTPAAAPATAPRTAAPPSERGATGSVPTAAPAAAAPERAEDSTSSQSPPEKTSAQKESAKPAPTEEARPEAASHHPARAHHRHAAVSDEPHLIPHPGSIYLSPSPATPTPDSTRPTALPPTNPFAQPPETAAPSRPVARPVARGAAPAAPTTLRNQFTIAPPTRTADSPSRDLAPAPTAEPEAPSHPAVTPAPRAPPKPADQPMAPSL